MRYVYLTLLCWLVIVVYWVVAAVVDSQTSVRSEIGPLTKLFSAGFLIYLPLLTPAWFAGRFYLPGHWANLAGVILCAIGAALSVWARYCLGRNWSGKVMLQAEHRLIQSGPYRVIRHPIYTGVLLMMLGPALVLGYVFSFVYLGFSIYGLIRKSRQEEELLAAQFPDAYPGYRKSTKSLLPFVY